MQDRMREMEKQLVKGLRKVSVAPRGAQLEVVPSSSVSQSHPNPVPFRLTHDPTAQGVVGIDRGRLCPYRQKEVIAKLKERLPSGPLPSTHDIWAINKVYNIEAKEDLAWKPEFSSRQYHDAFIDWVVERIQKDQQFLPDVRQKLYEMTH